LRRVVILGSTGSIGRAAIEVIERSPSDFEVIGLAAGSNIDLLREQLSMFPRAMFSVGKAEGMERLLRLDGLLKGRQTGHGQRGIETLIEETEPELIINALVGIAGLVPTVMALDAGCTVALANKESLVTAGELIAEKAGAGGGQIIPIDSEHFSLSRCLHGYSDQTIEIVLTASGGPFFGRSLGELSSVSVEDVLDHPTWKMGKKVTIDSAHLLNKGLEVIEAHHLFGFPYRNISVVIHPQSVVHSLIRLKDGSLLAHLGPADMKLPIMNALYHPRMEEFPWEILDLTALGKFEFFPLDLERFPAYRLALEAAETGGTAPAVLNAADEAAVEAFLDGRIGFLEVIDWIEEALGAHRAGPVREVEDVLEADRWARELLAKSHGAAPSH
jgi:1-deoxy-D-xylulose-5-phosphate reductoisomerase